jgi:riboflavin biosynthesis pyrimidine reductase
LHSLRSIHEGILIGINTLIQDNPQLNVRTPLSIDHLSHQPRPIILDSTLSILNISQPIRLQQPIIFTCTPLPLPHTIAYQQLQTLLTSCQGSLIHCSQEELTGRCHLSEVLSVLRNRFNISTLLVEGGANIIQSFIEQQYIDQVIVTIKPWYYGGYRSMIRQLPSHPMKLKETMIVVTHEQHNKDDHEKDHLEDMDIILRGETEYQRDVSINPKAIV